MLVKYKNRLFEHLKSMGFDPDEFDFVDTLYETDFMDDDFRQIEYSKIEHKLTKFRYKLNNSDTSFDDFKLSYTLYAPKFPDSRWYPPKHNFSNFSDIIISFQAWVDQHLNRHINERNDIDLWEEYKNSNKSLSLNTIAFDEIANFSIDEKASVRLGLNELKLLIQEEFKTTKEQQELVAERLDYLIEATERLNKFDWKGVAVNTIISITIALTMSPEQGNRLFQLFAKVLSFIPTLVSGN